MKVDILGVRVDNINTAEVLSRVEKWVEDGHKHFIVTPNPEIILAAQSDPEFKKVLNSADLAIPDSSSLGFSYWLSKKSIFLRVFLWPLFFTPFKQLIPFERVTGIELMEDLCGLAAEKGFTVGFLGGRDKVAKRTAECLKKKYPKLKVAFAESGGTVDSQGNVIARIEQADILFVAFGHIKQEKWIYSNLDKIPVHVAMGVGGAFDYLSGDVSRAPKLIRDLGFEWLFRLIMQPWRIKRQLALFKYIWLLVIK